MNVRTFIALFIFTLICSFRIDAREPLKLFGEITSIRKEDKGDSVVLLLELKMSFKNTGDRPVLLLTTGYPSSSPYSPPNGLPYLGICSKVSGVLPPEHISRVLSSTCALPSIEGTADWQDLRRTLDSKLPSPKIIKSVKAGESFEFRTSAALRFWKKRDLDSNFTDAAVWSEVNLAKDSSLQFTYRIWSLELERQSANAEKRSFGKKLQKRWSKYGYLWLDDIASEPISIDLIAFRNN